MRRGEVAFIKTMISESQAFGRQVMWFTTLVSRGENLPPLYRALTDVGAVKVVKKRWPRGKSRAALLPGPLWTTTSAVVLARVSARASARRVAATAVWPVLWLPLARRAETARSAPVDERPPGRNVFSPDCPARSEPSTASAAAW